MKKKTNIKECIDGDVLDLSMIDLQEVPVKEIATHPKIKNLDVSNNSIGSLSDHFSIYLVHIVKLDLSHNKLTSLPDNFGGLANLRYLDLSTNKLSTVPLSFGELRLLNWLDLSDNPLVTKIAEVVGICVNAADCQNAAKRLVAFMSEINRWVDIEKKRRKEIKKIQDEQAELELMKKKEKKDKKKKKKAVKPLENGDGKKEVNLIENDEFMQQQLHSYAQASRKRKPNIVRRFLGKLFKIFFYLSLFLFFSFFVLRLFDEPTYRMIKIKVNRMASDLSIHLPKGIVIAYNEAFKLSSFYGKVIWRKLTEFGHSLIVAGTEWYRWFSTDETVQLYVDALWHFSHALYVQFMDVSTNLYSKFNNWLQS